MSVILPRECRDCDRKESKDLEFVKGANRCKECRAKYNKIWYEKNKERQAKYCKIWYEKNKERKAENRAKCKEANLLKTEEEIYTKELKNCLTCKRDLDRRMFGKDVVNSPDALNSRCKECVNASRFSLTREEVQEKMGPNFTCYICGKPANGKALAIDHNKAIEKCNHEECTGKICKYSARKVLCHECNTGAIAGIENALPRDVGYIFTEGSLAWLTEYIDKDKFYKDYPQYLTT